MAKPKKILTEEEQQIETQYQIAIAQPLADKVRQAIGLIQLMESSALSLSPDGYYVAFSGGKDSIVMERLFKMAGVKYKPFYNNVTIDPPELVRFIKDKYPEVTWNNPAMHLCSKMADKASGPPTRLARWCCEIYKEQGGNGLFQAIGVRAPESQRRKGAWAIVSFHKRDNSPIMCPILYWTDVDIWTFIYEQKMEYCSLYDEGFARLGCIGCPMGGPKGMAKDFARWPHYEKLWKRGFQKYWDRWKGVPTLRENKHGNHDRWIEKMDSVDDLWNWWISGKAYEPPVRDAVTGEETDEELPADCQYNQW